MTPTGPEQFQVHTSGQARDQLIAAVRRAAEEGRGDEAIAAGRVIQRALRWLPDGVGESRQPLNVMGQMRCLIELPLTVYFAVDVDRRLVFVSRYHYASRRPRP